MKQYVDINTDDKTLSDKLTLTGSHVDAVIDYKKEAVNVVTSWLIILMLISWLLLRLI